MVMVFSLKPRTKPLQRKVCFPMIRLNRGAIAPALYSTISGVSQTDLLGAALEIFLNKKTVQNVFLYSEKL